MSTLTVILLSGSIGLLVGVIIGKLIAQRSGEQLALTEQLDNAKKQMREYQDEVAHHFHSTSQLVKEMTESHIKLSHHLASGANDLANIDITPELGLQKTLEDSLEPPKDWAPQAGALREDYRLSEDHDLASNTAPGGLKDKDSAIDVPISR